jgi:uncharacterized coiled-coil DUF342 family protein
MSKENKTTCVQPSYEERITELKRSVSAYKSANTKLKNELEFSRKKQDELVAMLDEKDKTINDKQYQIDSLKETIEEKCESLRKAIDKAYFYKTNYEYVKELPWYKRIFFKG